MVKLKDLSAEKIKEMSLIDLCYAYMVEEGIEKLNIYDFLDYIKPLRNVDEEEFTAQAAYFYTDLNLDGRFVCVEDGSWKLRDSLFVEDIKNFVEPSVQKFEIDDEDKGIYLEKTKTYYNYFKYDFISRENERTKNLVISKEGVRVEIIFNERR